MSRIGTKGLKMGSERQDASLFYPKHVLKPVDILDFVELHGFSSDWKMLGLNDDDLAALQICIMSGPTFPSVMPGTGGLRKGRFVPSRWKTGKRGGARICYVYFEEYAMVLLVRAYSKKEKDDLTSSEKRRVNHLITQIKKELAQKLFREE